MHWGFLLTDFGTFSRMRPAWAGGSPVSDNVMSSIRRPYRLTRVQVRITLAEIAAKARAAKGTPVHTASQMVSPAATITRAINPRK